MTAWNQNRQRNDMVGHGLRTKCFGPKRAAMMKVKKLGLTAYS